MRTLMTVLMWVLPPALLIALGVVAYATRHTWQQWLPEAPAGDSHDHDDAEDAHAGHDHGADDSIVLTQRARDNLGLKVGVVEPGEFWLKLPMPGEVVERPGRSNLALTTRVAGVIDEVHALPGQAVAPGDPLFTIRLTGDEVIANQAALINAQAQMKVNEAEIERIRPLVPGSVPEATLLKLRYEQEKLAVQRDLHEQELLAHGLSEEQVGRVAKNRTLLKELEIVAPEAIDEAVPVPDGETLSPSLKPPKSVYIVESIDVYPGRLVERGEHLGQLAAHGTLLVRGHAFEKESDVIERALENRWPVDVEFVIGDGEAMTREGLPLLYAQNSVASESRTLDFFLPLANEIVAEREGPDGGRYLTWRFKPGQQVRLLVPSRRWGGDPDRPEQDVIVLPALAVTSEGPDSFAFVANGRKLERRPVRVIYRDSRNVVIANDGAIFPGEPVALNNAYQLNLALKQQQGGGADPHAGHMH